MDSAGANWQMLDFGGRLHSFAEEETMMKGIAEFNAPAALQTYRMLDDFLKACDKSVAVSRYVFRDEEREGHRPGHQVP